MRERKREGGKEGRKREHRDRITKNVNLEQFPIELK